MGLLLLPQQVLAPSSLEKFLWGIPFIGIDKKCYALLRRIQNKRTEAVNREWNVPDAILAAKAELDKILVECFGWPRALFHPKDRCDALFFHSFGDLDDAEGYMEIEERFGKFADLLDSKGADGRSRVAGMTYLELLAALCDT